MFIFGGSCFLLEHIEQKNAISYNIRIFIKIHANFEKRG